MNSSSEEENKRSFERSLQTPNLFPGWRSINSAGKRDTNIPLKSLHEDEIAFYQNNDHTKRDRNH